METLLYEVEVSAKFIARSSAVKTDYIGEIRFWNECPEQWKAYLTPLASLNNPYINERSRYGFVEVFKKYSVQNFLYITLK